MNNEKRSPNALTEIKKAKILEQIIITPHLDLPPSYYANLFQTLLKKSDINERHITTLIIKIEKNKLQGWIRNQSQHPIL